MMSKISSPEKKVGLNLFLLTVRRNFGLILLFCFAKLLVCPGYLLVYINNTANNLPVILGVYTAETSICGSITVMIFLYIAFSYLYSKRSVDVFHSLPLYRSSLLLSRFFGAVVSALIPITLGFISFGCVAGFVDNDIVPGNILFSYICTVLGILIIASIFLIFIICAGGTLDLILSFFGVNIGLFVIGYILISTMENCIRGFCTDYSGMKYFSALFWFYENEISFIENENFFTSASIWFIIKALILISVLVVIAVILYSKRKSERSDGSYAYRFVYYLCSVIISFVGAYVIGSIFSEGDSEILFWLFAIPGAILTSVAFGAITNRSFKKFARSLIIGAVSVVLLIISYLCISNDIFGIGSYIPSEDKVKAVTMQAFGETITINDEIEVVTDIHKSVIELPEPFVSEPKTLGDYTTYLEFKYTLSDNSTVRRRYDVYEKDVIRDISPVLSGDLKREEILKKYENCDIDFARLDYQNYDKDGEYIYQIDKEDMLELVNIYFDEIKQTDLEKLYTSGTVCHTVNFTLYVNSNKISETVTPYEYFSLRINNDFKNTLDYISKLNPADETEYVLFQ